jgi:hypothetical protein
MELNGINMENTNKPNSAEDSLVLVLHSRQPASPENNIIIATLKEDRMTVFRKFLK